MRRIYGGSPLHLLGHVALFALAAYAVDQIFYLDAAVKVLAWLVAAVVVHDAVLFPLYSGANGALQRGLGAAVNYVRVPLALSFALALAFVGTISGKGEAAYSRASGLEWDGYVVRWLIVTAALFVVSGVVFLVRRAR